MLVIIREIRACISRWKCAVLAVAALFCLINLPGESVAQGDGSSELEDLKLYAVNVFRNPKQSWPGYGIYLGRGLVITAAHVLGHVGPARPTVLVAGQELEASIVKEGDFEGVDLTLLRIDPTSLPSRVGMRLMPLCADPPFPGQMVVVVIPGVIAPSRILSPNVLPADVRARFDTVIADVATTGNSGSGVFDARKACLLGIMSRKIQRRARVLRMGSATEEMVDVAKYFVPAAQIRSFLETIR